MLSVPASAIDSAAMVEQFHVDTTRGSLLHRLAASSRHDRATPSLALIGGAYLMAVAAAYLPLLVAAWLSPLPLLEVKGALKLPFLRDWNVGFMLLVSFPTLMALTLSDQQALGRSLRRVQDDGVVSIDARTRAALIRRWEDAFRRVNQVGQGLGALLGVALAVANYWTYVQEPVGFWIATGGTLLPVGYVYLACIWMFYTMIPVYVLRSLAISFLMRDVVAHAQLRILPLHPDHCGGLRPVGQLGLRNQYGLSVFGVNVVLLAAVSTIYLPVPASLYYMIAAASVAYVFVGPIVFMGPLLAFRGGMLRMKTELMSEVAQRLRRELTRIRAQITSGAISREDEELLDRLRKIGAVIDELPVWPFDASTLRRFLTAYVVPALGAASVPLLKWLFPMVFPQLNSLLR